MKKFINKLFAASLFIGAAVAFSACSSDNGDEVLSRNCEPQLC